MNLWVLVILAGCALLVGCAAKHRLPASESPEGRAQKEKIYEMAKQAPKRQATDPISLALVAHGFIDGRADKTKKTRVSQIKIMEALLSQLGKDPLMRTANPLLVKRYNDEMDRYDSSSGIGVLPRTSWDVSMMVETKLSESFGHTGTQKEKESTLYTIGQRRTLEIRVTLSSDYTSHIEEFTETQTVRDSDEEQLCVTIGNAIGKKVAEIAKVKYGPHLPAHDSLIRHLASDGKAHLSAEDILKNKN